MADPTWTILLLHGDPASQAAAAAMLASHHLLPAATEAEALATLRAARGVDAVVVTWALARSGWLERLDELLPRAVPVVLVESGDPSAALDTILAGRAAVFVGEPLRADALVPAVRVAVALGRAGGADLASDELDGQIESLKDDAILVAAHDLRSPLSVMAGYTSILLEAEGGLSERGRDMVERMNRTSERLLALVDKVLDISALESGKLPLHRAPCLLSDLVEHALEHLAGIIEGRKLRVDVTHRGEQRPVEADSARVTEVLQNLISNAVKFSADGGHIAVVFDDGDAEVAVSVRDEGSGLTLEEQARAFDKFTRFSPDAAQGSGLGLAIAKAIVEQHGGRIWIESEPGHGSTFHFTLPRQAG